MPCSLSRNDQRSRSTIRLSWLVVLLVAGVVGNVIQLALRRRDHHFMSVDVKSGLRNHTAWQRDASRELVQLKRSASQAGLLLLDVDDLKGVNDNGGHLAGDRVIKAIGSILQSVVRKYDVVGRYGGDEFVILLPESGVRTCQTVATRIHSLMANHDWVGVYNVEATRPEISVSIGYAVSPIHGVCIDDLIRAADRALYLAKAQGVGQTKGAVADAVGLLVARSNQERHVVHTEVNRSTRKSQ